MHRSLTALIAAVLILGACSNDDGDPAATIDGYVAAYNAGDINAVMDFFSEESVVTGHPFAAESQGLVAIREIHAEVGEGVTYTISITDVTDNTVTWDHVWNTEEGPNCVDGHTAVISEGKILTWTWPITDFQCG